MSVVETCVADTKTADREWNERCKLCQALVACRASRIGPGYSIVRPETCVNKPKEIVRAPKSRF